MPNDKVVITQSILNDIANAIKTKSGMTEQQKIKPVNMANAITSIPNESHLPINVNIIQSAHQTITVTPESIVNANISGSSIPVPTGVTLNATVVADTGYTAGSLNQSSVNAAWGSTVTFSASAAIYSVTYTITLAGTTNQTITLIYTEPGSSAVTVTSTSSNQTFTFKPNTTWYASIEGAQYYNPGTLSPGSSGTVNANVTISASAATMQPGTLECRFVETSTGPYDNGDIITMNVVFTAVGGPVLNTVAECELTNDEWFINLSENQTFTPSMSYTVTEYDITAGGIVFAVTDSTDYSIVYGSTTITNIPEPNAHLTVSITLDQPAYSIEEDEMIDFTITVLNDGNLTISGIDTWCDFSGDEWIDQSLSPGNTWVLNTDRLIDATLITAINNAGYVDIVAEASGTSDVPVSVTSVETRLYLMDVNQPFGGTITVNNISGNKFAVVPGSNVALQITTDSGFDFYGWEGVD